MSCAAGIPARFIEADANGQPETYRVKDILGNVILNWSAMPLVWQEDFEWQVQISGYPCTLNYSNCDPLCICTLTADFTVDKI